MKSLNPACKLIGLVVPTLLLAGLHHPAVNLAVFAVCLAALLLSRANVKVLAGTLVPVLLVAVGMFSTGYHFHAGAGMPINAAAQALTGAAVWNGLVLGSRVLAFAGLGLLFVLTTDRILLVRSLQQQLRLPPVFAYGLLAAWGILPNMMEEYKRTRAAFAARAHTSELFVQVRIDLLHAFLLPAFDEQARFAAVGNEQRAQSGAERQPTYEFFHPFSSVKRENPFTDSMGGCLRFMRGSFRQAAAPARAPRGAAARFPR